MLPTLGIMIGMYIVTRMLEVLNKKEQHIAVRIFAVVTTLVAVFSILTFCTSGASNTNLPVP